MIVGIDPSYSSTGLCICSDDLSTIYFAERFQSNTKIYKNQGYRKACKLIYEWLFDKLNEQHEKHLDEDIRIVCEYPGFRSYSGAFLAILHGWIDCLFNSFPKEIKTLVWVPPTSCDTYTGNKRHNKKYLENYVLEKGWSKTKLQHDIATALIFCHLFYAIKDGSYKNVVYYYDENNGI